MEYGFWWKKGWYWGLFLVLLVVGALAARMLSGEMVGNTIAILAAVAISYILYIAGDIKLWLVRVVAAVEVFLLLAAVLGPMIAIRLIYY